jgi:hypothetical protein
MTKSPPIIVVGLFLAALFFVRLPSAYAWDASTEITSDVESGHTVLIIQFTLPSYFGTPTPSHYPFEYQIRVGDQSRAPDTVEQWIEYPPVPIQQPTTAVFTVRYDFSAYIRYIFYVQARLHDNQAGWSKWGPDTTGIPVPEFPYMTIALVTTLMVSMYVYRRSSSHREQKVLSDL